MEEANKRTYCEYKECRKPIDFSKNPIITENGKYVCDNACRAMRAYDRACLQFEREFYSKIR